MVTALNIIGKINCVTLRKNDNSHFYQIISSFQKRKGKPQSITFDNVWYTNK